MRPAVYAGKPDELGEYDIYSDGEVTAYIHKSLQVASQGPALSMTGFNFFKRLSVSGISI
ncbi:MAG: hypothetical protein AB1497_02495 [Bacillota bacterium]